MTDKPMNIGINLVGDSGTGKTNLIFRFIDDTFTDNHIATILQYHRTSIDLGCTYTLFLYDTPGLETCDKVRVKTYTEADVVLICFAINNRQSFTNITSKWFPEVRRYKSDAIVVLVGMKSDLRYYETEEYVTEEEANKLKDELNAWSYVECSGKCKVNIRNVFVEAVKAYKHLEYNTIHLE